RSPVDEGVPLHLRHICLRAPLQRQLVISGCSVPARPAKFRPIHLICHSRSSRQQQDGENCAPECHPAHDTNESQKIQLRLHMPKTQCICIKFWVDPPVSVESST